MDQCDGCKSHEGLVYPATIVNRGQSRRAYPSVMGGTMHFLSRFLVGLIM